MCVCMCVCPKAPKPTIGYATFLQIFSVGAVQSLPKDSWAGIRAYNDKYLNKVRSSSSFHHRLELWDAFVLACGPAAA